MKFLPRSIKILINELEKLPGVGPKTAERFAFYLLKKKKEELQRLAEAVQKLKDNLVICSICNNIAESDPCEICSSSSRNKKLVAVVEKSLDIVALEKTGQFQGIYHVLGGVLSPIEGITADDLTIKKLAKRLREEEIDELILATNPTLEGESTASYIQKIAQKINPKIKITRIARGLPVGGDLEYADEVTLIRALEGRREY
jgi:recombination protein RecR